MALRDLLARLRARLRTARGSFARVSAPEGRPFLEVQYHPSDIKRGVRYLFLSRRQVVGFGVGAFAWIAFVVFAASVAPEVVRDAVARDRYAEEMDERSTLGERLRGRLARLEELEAAASEQRIRMAKIHLAYGFPPADARGKGGYPALEPSDVPESIYANEIRRGNGLGVRVSQDFAVLGTLLAEVDAFEENHRDQVAFTPSISPVSSADFVLTSPFGLRTSPFTKETDFHAGIDLAAKIGTPVRAPADGVVAYAGRYPLRQSVGWWRYGNLVALRHGDRYITLYGHCEKVLVAQGETVSRGDVIATVGDTGWSTNPHLHYEVRRLLEEGDEPIDPRIYMLDHEWRDEERLLVRARRAPEPRDFEPLPSTLQR